jgi:hypothetical protein
MIDLSNTQNTDLLIDNLVNKLNEQDTININNIQTINLNNSNVSIDGLKKLKSIHPKKYFICNHECVSSRFDMIVIQIYVNIINVKITDLWMLNNIISYPHETEINVIYTDSLNDLDNLFHTAHLQLLFI